MIRNFARTVNKSFPNLDPSFFTPSYAKSIDDSAKKPYAFNTWVYAACSAISTNLIQIPWAFDLKGTEEKELITEHPFFDVFKNPNPLMSATALIETIILNLLLPTASTKGGQCFLVMESKTGSPVSLRKGDIPAEIYPFSDASIKPILKGDKKELVGWELQGAKGMKIPYALDEVIRIYLTDPYNPLGGQSPIWAAMAEVRSDEKASKVNENFFDNNASLGGSLRTDAELNGEEVKMLRKQWDETYGGPDSAGRTAVIHSGLKYEQFQRSHADMQYIEQKKLSRETILAAYRVPKAEVSLYEDMNYATAISADKTFWNKVLLPHLSRIFETINASWVRFIDNGKYILTGDTSGVEALQENFKDKLEQAKLMSEMLIPVEEINRRLELNLMVKDYPWLSTSLVNFSMAPAGEVMEGGALEDGPEEVDIENLPPEEAIEESVNRLSSRIDKAKLSEEERERYLENYHRKVLRVSEKRMFKAIDKFFIGQRNRYLDKIDIQFDLKSTNNIEQKLQEPVNPNFIKLNAKKEATTLRKTLLPVYANMIKDEAEEMQAEIGPFLNWNIQQPGVRKFLKQRLKEITKINGTTQKRVVNKIKQVLLESQEQNLNKAQTGRELKKALQKLYQPTGRAKTIARTESGIMHAQTRNSVLLGEGFTKILWITSGDEKVRDGKNAEFSHRVLDGQIGEINEGGTPFNNGENIKYPKDPEASASNVINCRCAFTGIRD